MADAHVTQVPLLVVEDTDTDTHVTQVPMLVAEDTTPDVHVTQTAVLYAYEEPVGLRVSEVALLYVAPMTPCGTRRTQVWKITRIDGTEYLFTTLDIPIDWRGETYVPCDSLAASAAEAAILNSVGGGDIGINGLISDDSITESDMANGLFDGATVEVWMIPWDDPKMINDSPKRLIKGVLGETRQNQVNYEAQVFTTSAKLAQTPLLELYTPACRFEPGDGQCPVDIDSLAVNGTVKTSASRIAVNRQSYRQFSDLDLTGGASSSSSDGSSSFGYSGYFDFGLLTWTSGNNIGIKSEVKSYVDGVVTLWQPMPYEIVVGDGFTIKPGCDKTTTDHTIKFGLAMDSFGGFPDLPGADAAIRGATN